ncbi:MAG: hypothetical protein ACOYXC_10015 [Candidatus Rifleibacteriota bacterium]
MQGLLRSVLASVIFASLVTVNLYAQGNPGDKPPVATESQELDKASLSSTKAETPGAPEAGLTQNDETRSLEKAVSTFNQQYCPPETPIRQIDQESLLRLIRAELIKRSELEKYQKMVLVDGKVFTKEEKKEEEKPQDNPQKPAKPTKNNLFGAIDSAGKELEEKKVRGETTGNKKPEQLLKLKRRKIIYRDKENELKEMEMYSPPKFPAPKKKVVGKRGKKIKDFATTIMVPKNTDGEKSDLSAFDEMPSSDAWLDEGKSSQDQK